VTNQLAVTPVAPKSAEESAPILRVTDVHGFIGTSHILHGVTFDVLPGSVTAILGRNGVGKTSTLRAILGLLRPQGAIEFDGVSLAGKPTHRIIQLGISYVPEDRDVFHKLTVDENLKLAERRGQAPNYERVYDLFPEMAERRNQMAGNLSGGQQQMLSVSRALLNDNKLLIVDEPTKGLAPRLVTELVETLERIARTTTVLLVEQNLAAAVRLATHVVVIAEGRVSRHGRAEDLFADQADLRRALGVDREGD